MKKVVYKTLALENSFDFILIEAYTFPFGPWARVANALDTMVISHENIDPHQKKNRFLMNKVARNRVEETIENFVDDIYAVVEHSQESECDEKTNWSDTIRQLLIFNLENQVVTNLSNQ